LWSTSVSHGEISRLRNSGETPAESDWVLVQAGIIGARPVTSSRRAISDRERINVLFYTTSLCSPPLYVFAVRVFTILVRYVPSMFLEAQTEILFPSLTSGLSM
jgi:hypothetical protein